MSSGRLCCWVCVWFASPEGSSGGKVPGSPVLPSLGMEVYYVSVVDETEASGVKWIALERLCLVG